MKKQLIIEVIGFLFYLFELWEFHNTPLVFAGDGSTEIYFARFVLLYLALPLLYLFNIASFFDEEGSLSYFLSAFFKFEDRGTYTQVKMFYYATNYMLTALIILELISRVFLK